MQTHHWFLMAVIFAVAYYVGAKYPTVVTRMGL